MALQGGNRSWLDDIENLGYVFLYFMNPDAR
jgi:hypothetical protein